MKSKYSLTIAAVVACASLVQGCGLSSSRNYVARSLNLGSEPQPQRATRRPMRTASLSRPHGETREISPTERLRRASTTYSRLPLQPLQSEQACLRSGKVRESGYIRRASLPGGSFFSAFTRRGRCGAIRPFRVSATDFGRVKLSPPATLRCPMVPAVDRWMRDVVAPAAAEALGTSVTSVRVAASYSCRNINSKAGNKLSQHAYANAIDISAFTLADGRVITVKRGWYGQSGERRFLRAVHRGACRVFTTVLGPNADRYHHDHFHLDLARHGRQGTYRVCK